MTHLGAIVILALLATLTVVPLATAWWLRKLLDANGRETEPEIYGIVIKFPLQQKVEPRTRSRRDAA